MSNLFNTSAGAGTAQDKQGQTVGTFLASLAGSAAAFAAQILVFYVLKNRFTRIYRPKTYLVPEKDRTKPPPAGAFRWLIPVFTTSNSELIAKCGLDAYFFLRYLRMLLKIFVPSAVLILAILLPINSQASNPGVSGLDKLGWTNYDRSRTDRFWAHLLLAVSFLLWIGYVIYGELRSYIRVRQAYLTSPQHRLRASATTVLLRSVPRKWLTVEALDGLFDVFPGGVRNIWINRDFQELSDKVKLRDSLAEKLEAAETALIRNAKKKQMEMQKKEEKLHGKKQKMSRAERKRKNAEDDAAALEMADQEGISSGDPHQAHTVDETLGEAFRDGGPQNHDNHGLPVPVLGQGLHAVKGGLGLVTGLGKKIVTDVRSVPRRLDDTVEQVYEGAGFSFDGQTESPAGLAEQDHGRMFHPESATATSTFPDVQSPAQSPRTMTTGRSSAEQPLTSTVVQRDYALRGQLAPATPNSHVEPMRGLKSEDSARTAVDALNDGTRLTATASSSKKVPPSKLEFNSMGFLEPKKKGWRYWIGSHDIALPSPDPHTGNERELGIEARSFPSLHGNIGTEPSLTAKIIAFLTGKKAKENNDRASIRDQYPDPYNKAFMDDGGMDREPEWKKYLKPGDRDTMRLPLFGLSFMPFMPSWTLIGEKVDTIYYCRKEIARLNVEIETDQKEPEKFPLMNSAFIQFNNQVAAHMACQSVAHHFPATMAPRIVEIAPGDVIWDNMNIGYKQRMIRMAIVIVIISAMIILWAVPVSFASAFSNLRNVQETWKAFHFIASFPNWLVSILQGIVPPVLVIVLLALLPIILRLLTNFQGVPTGMSVELDVQGYYFAFLFVQLFLVITVASSIINVAQEISQNPSQIAYILATNIPRAANYFFSYLILQALSVSAGALAQISQIAIWFLLRPILDNTARQKFNRQINLQSVQWGTFFPVYTNLACIGLIYSIISPLVMIFNIITFGLFWVTYRYQTLYVNKFRFDTGGLLFPKAVNQLFTGIYVMELALIGLFLLVQDEQGSKGTVCLPQAIVMVVMLVFTIIFHILLNVNFSPLFRYIPITLEDDAVARDEEFALMQARKWAQEDGQEFSNNESDPKEKLGETKLGEDIESRLEHQEELEEDEEKGLETIEMDEINRRRSGHVASLGNKVSRMGTHLKPSSKIGSWADRSRYRRSSHIDHGSPNPNTIEEIERHHKHRHASNDRRHSKLPLEFSTTSDQAECGGQTGLSSSAAGQKVDRTIAVGDALFGNISDEIEDLTAEERDRLVQRAFQHSALRARRPVIWLPRDDLGVSDDEILRTKAFAGENIWISNEGTGLDRKARVLFRRAPPDFNEVDLIEL
ncbi:uncharacterized protein PV09_02328 [Verruconis gallopava]|uniref:CSC1/OSCA1-like 7TM region domain-containing protein n=1 Tax=Verruconis gallopava TaxID=253628 RepID=A0A0D2B5V7_9PEZI|nr:uncharacterized protein PV09_02328 [Verruconis gallopava]KIW06614.1 hypothetical protein PV09_02328 [Verruconis gallopava]